jgi:hypothetical protein
MVRIIHSARSLLCPALGADGLYFVVDLIHRHFFDARFMNSFRDVQEPAAGLAADRFIEKLVKGGGCQQPGITRGFGRGFGQVDLDHRHENVPSVPQIMRLCQSFASQSERSAPVGRKDGLLRRFAPRNDDD